MGQFYNPVRIYTGQKELKTLTEDWLNQSTLDYILVLTRGGDVLHDPHLTPLLTVMEKKNSFLLELDLSNPTIIDLVKIKEEIGAFPYQSIIAIGGGSVMDVAKVLAASKKMSFRGSDDIRQMIEEKSYTKQNHVVPWIGIPTTAGTGSEVTCWATIWDEERGGKYSIADERLYAESAVIIPELTLTVPMKLSVSTALDALSHATEAYWSVHTNAITRVYALEAIKRIRAYLPYVKYKSDSITVRKPLMMASLYAGLAFSNTKTTACHSISYPLTLQFGIPHGIAVSITLGKVLQINAQRIDELQLLLNAFGVEEVDEVDEYIKELFHFYNIPHRLHHYHISQEDIPTIVNAAYTKGRMDNNPVEITKEMLTKMLTDMI